MWSFREDLKMVAIDLNFTPGIANGNAPYQPIRRPDGTPRSVTLVPAVDQKSEAQEKPNQQANEKPSPLPQPTARFGYHDERVIELLDTKGEVITTFSLEVSPDQDPIRGHDLDKIL